MNFIRYSPISPLCVALLLLGVFASCSDESSPTDSDPSPFVQRTPYDWPQSTPAAQNLDTILIASAIQSVKASPFIYSFLIVRNGSLVVEEYRTGFSQFNDFEIRSVTKSFVSALAGIALKQGLLDSVGQRLLSFFPEYRSAGLDARKEDISVEHLLTMRAGFDYVEGSDYSHLYLPNGDWLKTTIDLPLKADPGSQFIYASPVTHLLSGVLTRVSGSSTAAIAEQFLFGPLKISPRLWDRDPQGIYLGGTGMNFTPRDLARFGYLYANQGMVDGTMILPASWIQESLVARNAQDVSWGDFGAVNYGYQWWTNFGVPDSLYMAAGYGGQFLVVIPRAQMVVVTTADPNVSPGKANDQELTVIRILSQQVFRAIQY